MTGLTVTLLDEVSELRQWWNWAEMSLAEDDVGDLDVMQRPSKLRSATDTAIRQAEARLARRHKEATVIG